MKRDDRYQTVLDALKLAGGNGTAKQVADALGVTPSYAHTVLNRMSARGLVRVAPAFAVVAPGPAPSNWEIPDLPERCKKGNHEWYLRKGSTVCARCGLTDTDTDTGFVDPT